MSPARARRPRPRDPEAMWAFGRRAALEALRSGRAQEVLVVEGGRALPDVEAEARGAGIPVVVATQIRLDRLAGPVHHQGVAVRLLPPARLDERTLAREAWPEDAVIVVLDGVEDPQNVGAVARVGEAAGASALVLRERRAAGVTPAAVRASAGALLHLRVAVVANIRRALDRLKEAGFTVVGLDGLAPQTIYGAEPAAGRTALVIGSEGAGLSRLVREGCDLLVSLPMRGRVESLNAATAAAAALYAFVLRSPGRVYAMEEDGP